jgi:enoyl-CoA hydratase
VSDVGADAEALIERRGGAGVVVLNRPKALNALTLTMVRLTAAALDAWRDDPSITRVVMRGAGDKAFCAGGDIRRLYEFGRAGDHDQQLTFWREEYQLNERIRTYPKPIVALIDGIVMGGCVGVSINASHKIAGERFSFAMPEVGIGFFPDVGGTYFLPRLERCAGVYLALTGLRADAGDALAFVRPERRDRRARCGARERRRRRRDARPVRRAGALVSAGGRGGRPEACFSLNNREAILAALEATELKGYAFAAPARAAMLTKSPTSQALALRQMALGPKVDFDVALRIEYRIVSRVCRGHDSYEGVRAVIVDKDSRPAWSAPPSAAELDACFAPLGDDELTFPPPRP